MLINILIPKQMIQRLLIALEQVKGGKYIWKQNESSQIIFSLYLEKEITNKVDNNISI